MNDEINTAVAEAEPESVDNQNISASDFVQRRSEALLGQQSEEESQELAEGASEEETPEQATEDNVLSQFDLDSLSDEDKDALRQQLIPGAQSRISELTARRKAAEESRSQKLRTTHYLIYQILKTSKRSLMKLVMLLVVNSFFSSFPMNILPTTK